MYRKYYSYNDMPHPVKPLPVPGAQTPCTSDKNDCNPCKTDNSSPQHKQGGILGNLSNDDLILAAVLIILLMDGCEDKLLLAAIGFLLLSDM